MKIKGSRLEFKIRTLLKKNNFIDSVKWSSTFFRGGGFNIIFSKLVLNHKTPSIHINQIVH